MTHRTRLPLFLLALLLLPVSALAQEVPDDGQETGDVKTALMEANSALQAKDYNKALEIAGAVADANPKQAGARFIAGAAALNLRQIDVADEYLREAWSLKPDMPWLPLWMGQLAILEGDAAAREANDEKAKAYYDEAVGYFDIETKNRPGNPAPLLNKAQALSKAQRLPESLEAYEELIRMNPEVPDYYLAIAEVYIQAGQIDKAITAVKRVPTTDKAAAAQAIYRWGDALYQQGLMDVVVPVMHYVHELDPGNAAACGKLVGAYLRLGHPPEAWEQLREYLSHNPPREEAVAVGDEMLEFLRRRGNPMEKFAPDENGIVPPYIDNLARPKAPPAARQARISTEVPVLVEIDADGKLTDAQVIPNSGSASHRELGLEEAALETVRKSRFKPGTVKGTAKASPLGLMIEFKP